jgi:hypothetical protein
MADPGRAGGRVRAGQEFFEKLVERLHAPTGAVATTDARQDGCLRGRVNTNEGVEEVYQSISAQAGIKKRQDRTP